MNKSLKWRLLGWTAGGMALLLGVFGVAVSPTICFGVSSTIPSRPPPGHWRHS